MAERTPLVAGNWKMYKTELQAEEYVQALLPRVSTLDGVEVAICVPFTDLRAMVDSTRGSRVQVYAQNMHSEPEGPFTGEISAPMLNELDVHGVVLGHSERRELFGETDRALAAKVPAALNAGLAPILCVGETESERDAGDTERKLRQQVRDDLASVPDERLTEVAIAYEPIWAIGQAASPPRRRPGGDRVHPRAGGRPRPHGGGGRADPLRRLGEAGERGGAAGVARRGRGAGGRRLAAGGLVRRDHRRGQRMTLPPGPSALPLERACLVVLDGWALADPGPGNAVSLARTPVFDELWAQYPHTTLRTCGRAVGLPDGQMGNSEVGHLNLGAGAVVRQDLVRIDDAIADGSFATNEVLLAALANAARVHLIGLVSDGGVHSSLEHLRALIELARASADDGAAVFVHAFTDGRDTLPHSGVGFLEQLERQPGARVGSVLGRYWAMDRDRRWERTQRAYDLLIHRRAAHTASSGVEAMRAAYERGETDEFVEPTLIVADAAIAPGDSVIAFNFRPDRMRQLTRALAEPAFTEIDRGGAAPLARYATLTEYEEGWPYPVAFPPERPATSLAATIAASGARQLHAAETEKYPHVTYFFNGGVEAPQSGERRELAPSPRDVPTYDHKPEMSAAQVASAFVAAWDEEQPALRDHQLRQRRHGGPHRRDRRRDARGGDRR